MDSRIFLSGKDKSLCLEKARKIVESGEIKTEDGCFSVKDRENAYFHHGWRMAEELMAQKVMELEKQLRVYHAYKGHT